MIGDTLNYDNLINIKKAMDKIKSNDQSDYFKSYYKEILERIAAIQIGKKFLN